MKRMGLVFVVVCAGIALLAPPANAKGIGYAHFTGPGLPSGGITIHGDHEELYQTGLMDAKMRSVHLSVSQLGPSYRATYQVDYAPHVLLHQRLYPYAEGGLVTFTPYGQTIGQDHLSFPGGWYYALSDLMTFLVAHGFPRHDMAASVPRVRAEPGVADAAGGSLQWPWFVLGGGILLGVGTTLVLRRRLRAREHRAQGSRGLLR